MINSSHGKLEYGRSFWKSLLGSNYQSDNQIGICCFTDQPALLRKKAIFGQSQCNVTERETYLPMDYCEPAL